jgi:hypothetical protein
MSLELWKRLVSRSPLLTTLHITAEEPPGAVGRAGGEFSPYLVHGRHKPEGNERYQIYLQSQVCLDIDIFYTAKMFASYLGSRIDSCILFYSIYNVPDP